MSAREHSIYSKRGLRQNQILQLLENNSAMSNYDLCNELSCSEATIRNDLRDLDKRGLIFRTRGGAAKLASTNPNPLDNFSIQFRINSNAALKEAVAGYLFSSGLIQPNQSIVIDMGSTCYMAAKYVSECDFPLSVATNSLNIANLMAGNHNISLALSGGIYYPEIDAFDTTSSLNLFSNMFFDYYFMGANGISKSSGVTCTLQDPIDRMPVKRLLMSHSQATILLCDHTKINKTYMQGICSVNDLNMIITDDACSLEEREAFLDIGTKVAFAPVKNQF